MRTTATLLAAAILFVSGAARADELVPPPPPGFWYPPPFVGEPQPEPPRQRQRWDLVAPGIVSLVGGYAGWVIGAITWSSVNTECTSSSWGLFPSCAHNGVGANGADAVLSFIPLGGPWASIATSSTMRGWDYAVAGLAGIAQAAGLITLIVGLALPVSDQVDVSLSPTGASVAARF